MVNTREKSIFNWFPVPRYLLLAMANIKPAESEAEVRKFVPLNTKFVNATLPDDKTYLFTAEIDRVEPSGLYDAVAFIIEKNVPITLSESVFSYEVINDNKSSEKIKVAVTVVPKDFINSQLQIFESAGVTVVSFNTESQSIARAVASYLDKAPKLILNLTLRKTGFYIVEEGVVQFSTTLARTSIDSAEGVENLRQANEIKAKVREIISFWGQKIEKIILCGALAGKHEFVSAIAGETNIKYELLSSWLD